MGLVWVAGLTGNSPWADRFRGPRVLLAGWTKMARSPRTVEDHRGERSSASWIEFHVSDHRCSGRAGRGFSPLIEPWFRAGNLQRVVQVDWRTKAEQQT
jgi:hypothetical protein